MTAPCAGKPPLQIDRPWRSGCFLEGMLAVCKRGHGVEDAGSQVQAGRSSGLSASETRRPPRRPRQTLGYESSVSRESALLSFDGAGGSPIERNFSAGCPCSATEWRWFAADRSSTGRLAECRPWPAIADWTMPDRPTRSSLLDHHAGGLDRRAVLGDFASVNDFRYSVVRRSGAATIEPDFRSAPAPTACRSPRRWRRAAVDHGRRRALRQ